MAAGKLNILSLHRMGPPWSRREAVRELECMMATYAPEHNCVVHDASLPLPDYIKEIQFHGIVLGPTFLCVRYDPNLFRQTVREYGWIKHAGATKIALPQDDYDCAAILDRWMVDWKIDLLHTVCPEHWDDLYPSYSRAGRIKLGYTGYISDRWIEVWANPRRHDDRTIDVSYRARDLPAHFGSVGDLKGRIAERFVRALSDHDHSLRLDVSIAPQDVIAGPAWHAFLENSKFCLTTPSGSSLLDPVGAFRRRVTQYATVHPTARFAEVAEHCFPGEDRKSIFTAIAPRNLEAALAKTVQIATPGSYSGLMKPVDHFIPLEEDCSNIKDVLRMMRDKALVERIAIDCRTALLGVPGLRFRRHVSELIEFIRESAAQRRDLPLAPPEETEVRIQRYESEFRRVAARYWRRQRIFSLLRSAGVRMGARRIRRLLAAARVAPA